MEALEVVFWVLAGLVFYTYIGYGILMVLLVKIFGKRKVVDIEEEELPTVTLFVAAYNEMAYLKEKVGNFKSLDYPKDKVQILFVTDGSDDGSEKYLASLPNVEVQHVSARGGKIGALNRGFQFVKNEIIIYSDANTTLNNKSLKNIVRHFKNESVGCVAGEKRIIQKEGDNASGAGEGLYWKYESFLKKLDSDFYSAVGAAGELFAIRKSLHQEVEADTLLDDFIISMRIAAQGMQIVYESEAYAQELPTANVEEELKRKVRISAGGLQSVARLRHLLNIFKYGRLSFMYISHRVFRWVLCPLALLFLMGINVSLLGEMIYNLLFVGQVTFYTLAVLGYVNRFNKTQRKMYLVPFYFAFMNWSVFMGAFRQLKGAQSVLWEKSVRANG